MNPELFTSIEYIQKERGIPKEVLIDALKQALTSACRKTFENEEDIEIEIDPKTYRIRLIRKGKEIQNADFGRIAAQTAKQVIIQKIREAERESIFDNYTDKLNEVVTGTVHRVEKKAIIVDLGKTEGILPAREQSPQDHYKQGHLIRAFVVEVKKTTKGPEIILSRASAGLVIKLFEVEVPEIHDGIVQVKGAAREAGSRTKIAVHSTDDKVDCVGSCVGVRGQRVKNIVHELGGEKIDIIRHHEDLETYIRNAMAPAELGEIKMNREQRSAEILVEDDQLSLAIGKKGQNVRLASKLLGWKIDVRSKSQKVPIGSLEGVGAKTEAVLKQAGYGTLKDLLKASPEDLAKCEGIGMKSAENIIAAAQRAILNKDKKAESIASKLLDPAEETGAAEESPEKSGDSDESQQEEVKE